MDDRQRHQISIGIGIGLTALFGFLPYVVKDMNQTVAWIGIGVGCLFILWGLLPLFPLLRLRKSHGNTVKGQLEPIDTAPGPTYLTPYEVCHYLAEESQWGSLKAAEITPDGLRKNVLLESPGEFQDRAAEGKVRVYGAPKHRGLHELIGKTFWMSGGFHHSCAFNPIASRTDATTFEAGYSGVETYYDLKIEAEDVYKTWPRM